MEVEGGRLRPSRGEKVGTAAPAETRAGPDKAD